MLQQHQRAKESSQQATNTLSTAWRKNTKSKYEGEIKRYVSFCYEREADPYNSNDTIVIEFLTQEFKRGLSSSAINGMITAIKKINSQTSTELIRTFKKGALNLRPPVTKYHKIWDPDVLLSYLGSMDTAKSIHLSMKTASLIMLLSEHLFSTLENLKITNMYISETECTFVFSSVLKRSRPLLNVVTPSLKIISFKPKPHPVTNITQYLKFQLEKSADEGFFITTVSPYKQCSKDTIARWIKETLSLAGINSGIYLAHSLRSSSTSLASYKGVNLSTILKSANWI